MLVHFPRGAVAAELDGLPQEATGAGEPPMLSQGAGLQPHAMPAAGLTHVTTTLPHSFLTLT